MYRNTQMPKRRCSCFICGVVTKASFPVRRYRMGIRPRIVAASVLLGPARRLLIMVPILDPSLRRLAVWMVFTFDGAADPLSFMVGIRPTHERRHLHEQFQVFFSPWTSEHRVLMQVSTVKRHGDYTNLLQFVDSICRGRHRQKFDSL